MKTLIVPCADRRKINGRPLFLNMHPEGVTLAEKAISGIHPEEYQRIIFTILRETEDEYGAESVLKEAMGKKYPIEVCVLEDETDGPADTVYETILNKNISEEFAARDSLNYINVKKGIRGNFLAGLDLTKFDEEIYKVKTKSFIILNEQKQVLDVVEKKFRSDVISVGLYGFKNVDDFLLAYRRLKDVNYPIKGLYLSNIISYLIGYKHITFRCEEVNEHEDWGSEETWQVLQKKYALCFVDLDKLVSSGSKSIAEDISAMLAHRNGFEKRSYVFYTHRTDLNVDEIRSKMIRNGIKCIGIVTSCPITERKILAFSEKDL